MTLSATLYYHQKLWLLVASMSLVSIMYGQSENNTTPLHILGGRPKATVPFEYHQGFIIVKVYLENFLSLNFIFDTGAEHTILLKSPIADMLQLPYHKKINIIGADLSSSIHAYVSNGASIRLDRTEPVRHNIVVMEENYTYLEECIGVKVDGILGAEFFKGLIIRINFKSKEITFFDPSKFNPSKCSDYLELPITIVNSKPYLKCTVAIDQTISTQVNMLLDTGAGLSALFHDNTDTTLKLPNKIVKGQLGVGLGGEIEGFNGKVHKLTIGTFELPNLISSFQSLDESLIDTSKLTRNGLIGNLILERFDVFLDLNKSKIFLKPYKNFDKPIKYDKSGMTIYASGANLDQYYIKTIVKGSPADIAGVQVGDIITKIGCWSTSFYSMNSVINKFSGKTGKTIYFKVKRGEKKYKLNLKLKELF